MTDEERIAEHFEQYRKFCERVHTRTVQEALEAWTEWQEVTALILQKNSKNREFAAWKLADAAQRRSEAVQIAEKAKDRRKK